jgi:hypothetical protein
MWQGAQPLATGEFRQLSAAEGFPTILATLITRLSLLYSCRVCRRQPVVMAAAPSASTAAPSATAVDYYSKLQGKIVYRSSDGAAVDIPSMWQTNEKAVVAFGRSFG